MAEVTIAIPTFRRPQGLEKLLRALERLQTSHAISVLVADNDGERHEGIDTVVRLTPSYRWPLQAIVVHERGIAQNRNALVEQSLKNPRMEFLAMLDDDEWPEDGWLDSLLDVQRATDADAVAGAVLREFEHPPGRLAAHCDGLLPARGKTGITHEIDSTANVLVRRACFDEGYRFDPEFALTGGEDRDFFTRLARDGKRFAWSDEAVVYSHVPASRASLSWGLARAYRAGNSDMRVLLKYGLSPHAMTREIAKIVGAIVIAPFAFLFFIADAGRAANAIRRVFRAAGKIAAFFGRHYNEYAVVHGK
jgi:glycosyltransferase involved in cell wall biosynthesis